MAGIKRVGIIFIILCSTLSAQADEYTAQQLLRRIYAYVASVPPMSDDTLETYAYMRYSLHVQKRNWTLMAVPTMYALAHGKQRQYVGESLLRIRSRGSKVFATDQLLSVGNIPHHRQVLPSMIGYTTPTIYQPTIVKDYILSPFCKENRKFYHYQVIPLFNGTSLLRFKPRRVNTQLVRGEADVDTETGRIISCTLHGEYDMINFTVEMVMNEEKPLSLTPHICTVRGNFKFLGNLVAGLYHVHFGLSAPDSTLLTNPHDHRSMGVLRPDSLPLADRQIFMEVYRRQEAADSLKKNESVKEKKRDLKYYLWNVIGDNVVNSVKSHFGNNNQGYVRLNPILNPLYMGYDHKRGFIYKFDIRASYLPTANRELSLRVKAGYSFKQRQLYYQIPFFFYYNKRRNGYIRLEISNGNHIKNNYLEQHIREQYPFIEEIEKGDGTWRLNEFKRNETRLLFNYDISDYVSFQVGGFYKDYKAINSMAFDRLGWQKIYRSVSPFLELQLRPWGWKGPFFTMDYDRAIKNILRSNMEYERWEANAEYIHHLDRLQSLQMRLGFGFYTKGSNTNYFLDYENFRENNLPGGWNDDWSGEFELLNGDDYNYSNYYIRANLTYESPLLLFSRIPWAGHYIELERIYISALDVKNIHPYVEAGYGFTTRLFSIGVFTAFRQGKFDGFGCKWGFELFRKW